MVPGDLKLNESFCRRVLQLGRPYLARNVFAALPSLAQKWQSWQVICSSYSDSRSRSCDWMWSPLVDLMDAYTPSPYFLSNENFMEMIYHAEPQTLKFADSVALTHFVQQKIRQEPKHLVYCSEAFLGRSRAFVEGRLVTFCNSLHKNDSAMVEHLLLRKLQQDLKEDEAFLTLWALAGLPMSQLIGQVHTEGLTVRDKLLLSAKHGHHLQWKLDALAIAPEEVRNDRPFIEELMEYEPSLFAAASQEIRNDNFELAMMALSCPAFVNCCRRGYARAGFSFQPQLIFSAETLEALVTRAKHEISLHDKFMKTFLCVLHRVADRDGSAVLQVATSELYGNEDMTKLIGEFVGYPRGAILQNMRAALRSLENLVEDPPVEAT